MSLNDRQRAFLNEVHFAVVATIASDGLPHQTVMWYMLDGEQFILSTPYGGLKHRHLKRDPRISICVEKAYSYVTLIGRIDLDEDPARAREVYQRLGRRYGGTFNFAVQRPDRGDREVPELLSRERVTLRMSIDRILSNGL